MCIRDRIKAGGVFQNKTDKFGTISYQAHMRGIGWGNWQSDGLMVGSTGQNRRTVSYTHLDVYKRQNQSKTVRSYFYTKK